MINLDDLSIPCPIKTLWKFENAWFENEKELLKELLKKGSKGKTLSVQKYDYLGACLDKPDVFMISEMSYNEKKLKINDVALLSEGMDADNYEYLFETKNGFFWNGYDHAGGINSLYEIFIKYGIMFNSLFQKCDKPKSRYKIRFLGR